MDIDDAAGDRTVSQVNIEHVDSLDHTVTRRLALQEGYIKQLKAKLCKVRKQKKALGKRKTVYESTLCKLFRQDQLQALSRRNMRGIQWSSPTVKRALQLRFACGASGYNLLLQQSYPLPSVRTLQRRMKTISFHPGILHQVFQYLQLKVKDLHAEEKVCCLTLDEMSITPNIEYDQSSGQLIGNVTLPGHSGIATHALVFMLGGITSRWKQTVAYHYSGNSTDGRALKPIVLDILRKASEIGLTVIAVTSDMGSVNRALWGSFNLQTARHCTTVNKIVHPVNADRSVYFLADVPHLIKNLKAALVRGNVFTLPDSVVEANHLSSCNVSVTAVKDLAEFQDSHELKLAPKLTLASLTPSHFDKMKVSAALHFFSNAVVSGLRYLVKEEGRSDEYLTTAWFLAMCNHWFDLMSSRHPVVALSKLNPQIYEESVTFLKSVISVFKSIKIGDKGYWKPVQTGVVMSTTSVLELQEELLGSGHHFLLTSRLTQDCLENLFSVVRMKNPIPSPLEFKFALKIISMAQFLKPPSASYRSYQDDDSDFAVDFLCQPLTMPSCDFPDLKELTISDKTSVESLSKAELNSLYYLGGYCVHSLKKTVVVCDRCLQDVISSSPGSHGSRETLTTFKEFKKDCLEHLADKAFTMLLKAEMMFRSLSESSLLSAKNVREVLIQKAEEITPEEVFLLCHSVKRKLLAKYFSVRLHIFCKNLKLKRKKDLEKEKNGCELGSRSMAMRKLVQKVK